MKRFMAAQLRKPSGWFGSLVVSKMLNRVNRQIVERTLELLEVTPDHHVLEIGFGGGSAIALLTKRLSEGLVAGVDFSPEMVRNAERNFRREIADGRVQVLLGDVARLPFPDAAFDRAFTINTIYFWPDTLHGLAEIRRVLKPEGIAAISIRSREKMQKHGVTQYDFRLFEPQDVADLMREAGFRDIRVEHRDRGKWYDQGIITGIK